MRWPERHELRTRERKPLNDPDQTTTKGMLLHIVPKFFGAFEDVGIVDIRVEPLGLCLRGGVELATRRPYPNKRYAVACRRSGRKAVNGILLAMDFPISDLFYVARWAVEAEKVVTHRIRYRLLDQEFDAASESMMLWNACSEYLGGWSSRWPDPPGWKTPAFSEPRMEVELLNADDQRQARRQSRLDDVRDSSGWIVERQEEFHMPTLERGRFTSRLAGDRMPRVEDAFRVSAA